MFKLDFSELHNNGFKINQLRLFHSLKFRGLNFMKNKQTFIDNGNDGGEKNLILEYIIERMEIMYTQYLVFSVLTVISLVCIGITIYLSPDLMIRMLPLVVSFICWRAAKKGKENFVMAHVGYGLAESMYDFKIREKYNL